VPGRTRAFLARQYAAAFEAKVAQRYEVVRNPDDGITAADRLVSLAAGCSYLFVSPTETVSRAVFDQLAGSLSVVATLSVGFDHIDLDAAREHGVAVFNTPDVLSDACAEVGMMLILNAARRAHEGNRLVRSGEWNGWAPTQLLGVGLVSRRLGILGMGRIGQALAKRARPFGLAIHYHNRHRLDPECEGDAVYHDTAEHLLAVSDIFAITASRTPELNGFLNRDRLAMLPRDAIVINIARGEVIDDDALIESLTMRRLFAAGLDVFRHEPAIDPRYRHLDNVFLTPHLGSATEETRLAMGDLLLEGIEAFEKGCTARNRLC
jgi:lactate dehydrogenase-like 2-hydroxyacid dehydrogenase